MKPLSNPKRVQTATNCTGPNEWFLEQDFGIEPSDVGMTRPHYCGFGHAEYTFAYSDVGRVIRRTSQPSGYICWNFIRDPY